MKVKKENCFIPLLCLYPNKIVVEECFLLEVSKHLPSINSASLELIKAGCLHLAPLKRQQLLP